MLVRDKIKLAIWQAVQDAGLAGEGFLENIEWIIKNTTPRNFDDFGDLALPVGRFSPEVQGALGADRELVHLKPRIYAKVKDWWDNQRGHPEITDDYFYLLPYVLHRPEMILADKTYRNRFLFLFTVEHHTAVVVEVESEAGRNEIVTYFWMREDQPEEHKKVWTAVGRTCIPSVLAPRRDIGVAGSRFPGLQPTVHSDRNRSRLLAPSQEIHLEHPADPRNGDYSSNFALAKFDQFSKPMDLAQRIVDHFPPVDYLEKVEVVPPGFINFWLSKNWLIDTTAKMASRKSKTGTVPGQPAQRRKVMVEYAHPNTHKPFHIGHLRNIALGESVARILEVLGNKVVRANYQGDVGLHIAKALYGILQNLDEKKSLKTLAEKIDFLGKMYVLGSGSYEEDARARRRIIELNRQIYDKDPEVAPLWEETRQWSLEYFDHIYRRVGTRYDRLYFESEVFKRGLEIAKEAQKRGVLEESAGALIFNGKKYGLDTRVFVTREGFATYEAKELGLAELEFSEFGELDKCIHVVAPEQISFFKVTFKVEELIDPKKYQDRQYHLVYGYVRLKEGKMSSRLGKVVEGNWLLDETKKRVLANFDLDDATAEAIAIGAVKYSLLKVAPASDLIFDIDESISLEGNSGPYLQYTHSRTRSVLKKSQTNSKFQIPNSKLTSEELSILRTIYRFPEVVLEAGESYAPNLIGNFLFDLAQKYNTFYQRHRIIDAPEGEAVSDLRLVLTAAVGKVIKDGLYLLGIPAPPQM
jgi:arginyl-tRNA synthetase